jgi:anti-anti-sigma factor
MESDPHPSVSRYVRPLSVERTARGSAVVFSCCGPFSILNDLRLREFEREVADAEGRRVVLDFRDVTYLDSRGLGTLIGCMKKTQALQKELCLVTNPNVRDLVVTTGLDKVLRLCDSVEDALN